MKAGDKEVIPRKLTESDRLQYIKAMVSSLKDNETAIDFFELRARLLAKWTGLQSSEIDELDIDEANQLYDQLQKKIMVGNQDFAKPSQA